MSPPLHLLPPVAAALRAAGPAAPRPARPARAAAGVATDLGGLTDLAELGLLLAGSSCLVVGNTGPAHLAAAVGTPVVSLFAPTVPYRQWGPYGTARVRLGDPQAACRDTRATVCPVPGHPCLSEIEPAAVLAAVELLTADLRTADPFTVDPLTRGRE